jgi:hypothetical protein
MTMPKHEQHKNNASTLLNGGINNSVTTVDVDDATVFPTDGNFRVMVDDEVMIVTAISSNALTVVRGQDNTSAASHSDDASINMIYSAEGLGRLFNDFVGLWGYSGVPPVSGVFNDAGTARLGTGDFTWVNQGSASIATNDQALTLRCPTDASNNLRMLSLTPGGASWTYIAAFRAVSTGDGNWYGFFGLGFRESATGKIVTLGYGGSSTDQIRQTIGRWSDSSTLSGGAFVTSRKAFVNRHLIWQKAEYDGTNLKFYTSPDGVVWIQIHSETKTTFLTTAPDQIVWYGSNLQNSGTGSSELVISLDHWHKE